MKFKLLLLVASVLFLIRCSKELINVSKIYTTNEHGNLIGSSPNDDQWKNMGFSAKEMALFRDMDTADLSGTIMPTVNYSHYASPNPFKNFTTIHASLSQHVKGWVVVKYVVVNRWMKPVQKAAQRVSTDYGDIDFRIPPSFKSGNYRVYFTYSAQGHEHFYKSWGNIKKL